MFKKLLVPLDGSILSEEVLPLVKGLLEMGVEEATVFRVGEAPRATVRRRRGVRTPFPITSTIGPFAHGVIPATSPTYVETKDQAVEREEHELLEYLEAVGRPLVEAGRRVQAAVHFGEPATEIIDFAKKGQFDLIVMATHGRSGLRETLHGSVTAAVVRSGVAPVLVLRPAHTRGAQQTVPGPTFAGRAREPV